MKVKEFLKRNSKVFLVWTILGWAAQFAAAMYLKPWGPGLGVAESPQRQVAVVIFTWWVARLPMALLGASIVAKREEWLAPRGKYVAGRSYPLLDTYSYTAIAFLTALFAACGVFSWQVFDLPAAAAAIAATYFNPVVAFFSVWLGGSLRTILFGQGNPLSWFAGIGLYDGTTWMWVSIVYWVLRSRTRELGNVWPRVFWVLFYVVFRAIYELDYLVWLYPVPSLWASITWWEVNFLPTSALSAIAGLIAAEAIILATETRSRTRGHSRLA